MKETKGTTEKIKDSGRLTWSLIIGIPFIIGLLRLDEIIYIGYIAILIIIFIIVGFLDEKTFGNLIRTILITPFIGFVIFMFLFIPFGIGKVTGGLLGFEPTIKGNISFETNEKIYHVPGCKHYEDTIINTSNGERWFKTEEEAKKAGWRKCRTDD